MEKIWMLIQLPNHPRKEVYNTIEDAILAATILTERNVHKNLFGVMELVGHTQHTNVPVEFKDV